MSSRLQEIALPGVLLLLLAGCAGGAEDEQPEDAAGTTESAAPEPMEEDDATEEEPTDDAGDDDGAPGVMVGTTALGEVLVDADGMTLYLFDPDAQGASTCYDDCAIAWPPLVTEGEPAAGEGADDSLLGTVERTDGAQQVTYDGWPLYYFAQDAAMGDANGQGLNGVWWVLDAEGQPIKG